MSAVADIQKSLNAVRAITAGETEQIRLQALRLIVGVVAEELNDIDLWQAPRRKPQRRVPPKVLPSPRPKPRVAQPNGVQKIPSSEPRDLAAIKPRKPVAPV